MDERHRQRGHGRQLVQRLLEHARSQYRVVRVGAGSPAASAFFEALGFGYCAEPQAYTHELRLHR